MIRSFQDKETERIWKRQRVRQPDDGTQRIALRTLLILDAAEVLGDLKVPPGNRLEKLKGDRAGSYSIRVNQQSIRSTQWRICFNWSDSGAEDVELVDYH